MRQTLFDARDISIYHIYIYIYCPLCVRTSCFERRTYDICVCVCERERDKYRDRERQRETEWQADRWTDRQSDFYFYFANKWYSKFIGCMYHCAQTDCGMDLEPKCVGLKFIRCSLKWCQYIFISRWMGIALCVSIISNDTRAPS